MEMRQLLDLQFIIQDKGMAISIDALLAILLFIGMIAFLSIEPISEDEMTQPMIAISQIADDAIAAMDNTGFMMQSIEDGDSAAIETKLQNLLPGTVEFRLKMLQYTSNLDDPTSVCKSTQDFEDCFPSVYPGSDENPKLFFEIGRSIPEDKEIFHGKKIFIKKEPGECELAGSLSQKEANGFVALFQASHAPEAKDVNITTEGSCPGQIHPCPTTEDTMRCCYKYFDEDSDPEVLPPEFKWYKYDAFASGDKWILTTETGQTVGLGEYDDDNRWKCSVSVNDGSEWSQDANSPVAIIGGPCFIFSSSMTNSPMACGETSSVSFTVSGEASDRQEPVDIMLSIDRSGSMSWIGQYNATGTERSVFVENDIAYLGTSSYVYKLDVNQINGSLTYTSGDRTIIDDARGLDVDGDHIFVADDDSGITVVNKSSMSVVKSISNMTTARSIFVDGDYGYVAAAGTLSEDPIQVYGASMTGSRDDYERVGYTTAREWVAQSFVSDLDKIEGVRLELYRYDNPSGDLTVHLRSTIDGADLPNGTVTIDSGDIRRYGYRWENIDFPGPVDVDIGSTYYLVLTTTDIDSGDYYRWASRSRYTDPYTNGSVYRCNTSDVCTAVEPPFQSQYEDARFRIYHYDYLVGGLVIIDKSDADPNNWTTISNLYDTGSGLIDEPEDVFVEGDYVYIADKAGGDGTEGLWIVDISDKENPVLEGFIATTNPQAVAVSGNYAFVADEDSGLRIIDVTDKANPSISLTLTGIGSTSDVVLYDTNAYVVADTGSGATASGLHVIDVTSPATASLTETFDSPYNFYKLFAGQKYAFVTTSYGLMTINRFFGPKINFARAGAKDFVMFEDWKSPEDKIGVASYGNGNSSLDHQLVEADAANKASINTAIDGIMSMGGTPMHLGLEEALDELLDSSRGREDAIQFVILLADGQSDSYTQDEIDTQVARANDNQVYIFTIGFGGDVDDTQMRNIAENAYCPELGVDCGAYHHIDDPEALSEIYAIIAEQVTLLTGKIPDAGTTDLSMEFTDFAGLQLSNFSPAYTIWDGTTLSYEDIDITEPWTAVFDAMIPCDYVGCGNEFVEGSTVLFPPDSAEISYTIDDILQEPVDWPERFGSGSEFYYNDLGVDFLSGTFYGTEDTVIDYLISNQGYIDDIDLSLIDPTMEFYKGDAPETACSGTLVGSNNSTAVLDAALGASAGPNTSVEDSTNVLGSGWICMQLNNEQDIIECSENNNAIIHCAIPKTFVYTLDYWVWEK